jgi:hypothetical protein
MTTLNIPSDLPLSSILFKQCKLWVWDFDDTLINTETYYSSNMSPEAILNRTDEQLNNEVPQWRYFQRLVEFLVGHGRYVGIASFGTYEIIQAYLKRIMGFNQQFFTRKNIVAPEYKQRDSFRFNQPPNKNEYIYQLMRIYRVQDFKRVVLFDDNATNIADAIGIGIVGIQVPSLNGGDNPTSNKLFFGPWIMADFDSKLANTCGDEIYRNRTYTGLVSKENYIGNAYDKPIDYGTGVRSQDGYFMEPYNLDVSDASLYQGKTHAFGTGIGDRKINNRPQFQWNSYRMAKNITPQFWNGNYINIPGKVETTGYWNNETLSLGGSSLSFWDKQQKVMAEEQENDKKNKIPIIYPNGGTNWNDSGNVKGVLEGFSGPESNSSSNSANCGCTSPPAWLLILLFILIVIISVIIVKL